jgi:signal transduction histidine kinase
MSWSQSLRLRLLLGGALWIAAALVVAGFFIVASFSASIEQERRDDLEASLDRLTASIDSAGPELAAADPLSDPRYDTPLSGLYWQVDDVDRGQSIRSRSLWDQSLSGAPTSPKGALSEIKGPDGRALIVLRRDVEVVGDNGTRHYSVAVAEARDQDKHPFEAFTQDLILAFAILGVALLVAMMLQVHFGLRPLRSLKQQIAGVRQGLTPHLPRTRTDELVPVVEQINELIDAQEATIQFARDRAADLAHGLKTPLAVLSASSERLRQSGDQANGDLLQLLAQQMDARIDYQLRIARLRFRTRAQGTSASLNDAVLRSVAVLRKSPQGERLNWLVDLEPDLRADIDEHDLMELVGIVLENASQWAAGSVEIRGARHDGWIEFVTQDDGAGVSDEEISRLGTRGYRLDEQVPGDGLGLAIGSEILRLNRGTLHISRGAPGGLRVVIRLTASQ